MSYAQSQLESGEKIVFQTRRTAGFILAGIIAVIGWLLGAGIFAIFAMLFIRRYPLFAVYPWTTMVVFLSFVVLALFFAWSAVGQTMNTFKAELALTDRRVLGRAAVSGSFLIRVDLPLDKIESIHNRKRTPFSTRTMTIIIKPSHKLVLWSPPHQTKEFIAQFEAVKRGSTVG